MNINLSKTPIYIYIYINVTTPQKYSSLLIQMNNPLENVKSPSSVGFIVKLILCLFMTFGSDDKKQSKT